MIVDTLGSFAARAMPSALALCTMPALCMMAFSLVAINVVVPVPIVAALQHLAAGIVLSAVAIELLPPILDAPDDALTTFCMTVGFVLGVAFFLLLGAFCHADEHDDDDSSDDHGHSHDAAADSVLTTRYRSESESLSSAPSAATATKSPVPALLGLRRQPSKMGMMREIVENNATKAELPSLRLPSFPFALAVAVCTDAMVDGLLIGIASSSGKSSGLIIALALTVEMAFLGLTFAVSLRKQPWSRSTLAILLPPLLLLLGGAVGDALGAALTDSPPLHTGLLAFGVAALLYLVTEELLLEAHAQGDDHVWWVDACFFAGFGFSLFIEKSMRHLR